MGLGLFIYKVRLDERKCYVLSFWFVFAVVVEKHDKQSMCPQPGLNPQRLDGQAIRSARYEAAF